MTTPIESASLHCWELLPWTILSPGRGPFAWCFLCRECGTLVCPVPACGRVLYPAMPLPLGCSGIGWARVFEMPAVVERVAPRPPAASYADTWDRAAILRCLVGAAIGTVFYWFLRAFR